MTNDTTNTNRDTEPSGGRAGGARRRDAPVIVIGAGLAGLTAAATLVRAGVGVVVLERSSSVDGGRAATTERHGFSLNVGPHALYRNGRGTQILQGLGIRPVGSEPPPTTSAAWSGGRACRLPSTPMDMLRTPLLSPRSKLVAGRIMPRLQRGDDPAAIGLTLREWFERRGVPADLARMIEMSVRLVTFTHDPERVSAAAALAQLRLGLQGVLYLDGGWQQLVHALVAVVRDGGASFVTGATVRAVGRDGRNWVVDAGRAGVHRASHLVMAAGGPRVAEQLFGREPGWVERVGPPVTASVLDVGASEHPDYTLMLSTRDPLYGSVMRPSNRLAPDDHVLLSALRYQAPGDEVCAAASRAGLSEHVARMGVRGQAVTMERYLHRLVVAHGMPLAGQPRPTGRELAGDGVWCVGDWVGPTDDVDGVPLLADAAIWSGCVAGRDIASLS